jgi:hypothetical protein
MTILLPPPGRERLLVSLDNMSTTLSALLSSLPPGSPIWDTRPDPERFRLREIVAHLADWEEVGRGRFERTMAEDRPQIARPDVNQRAEEQGYCRTDPVKNLASFAERRTALVLWLRALPESAWGRVAHLDRIGDVSLEGLATLALGHDSYHIRQIAEWLAAARPRNPA